MDHDHVTPPAPRHLGWRHVVQTVALLAFAFSLNGWEANSCNKSYVNNPLNNQTKTRLEVDVQPPEMRPFVRRLTVERNSVASTSSWTGLASVTGLSGNPTAFDVEGEVDAQYRIQAWDACDRLLVQKAIPTGITKSGDTRKGPDRLTTVLQVPEGGIAPCEPSPSPSVSPSATGPSPSAPVPSASPPAPVPSQSPPAYSGGGGGNGGGAPANASVTVNLNGQIQRGTYAGSEGNLTASPSAFVSASPTPSATPTPSPSPSF